MSRAFKESLKRLRTKRNRLQKNDRHQLARTEPTFLTQFSQFLKRNCPIDGIFCYEPLDVCDRCWKTKMLLPKKAEKQ